METKTQITPIHIFSKDGAITTCVLRLRRRFHEVQGPLAAEIFSLTLKRKNLLSHEGSDFGMAFLLGPLGAREGRCGPRSTMTFTSKANDRAVMTAEPQTLPLSFLYLGMVDLPLSPRSGLANRHSKDTDKLLMSSKRRRSSSTSSSFPSSPSSF